MATGDSTITAKLVLDTSDYDNAIARIHDDATTLHRVRALREEALTNPTIDGQLKALGLG